MKITITFPTLRCRDHYANLIFETLCSMIKCFRHGDTGIGEYTIDRADL